MKLYVKEECCMARKNPIFVKVAQLGKPVSEVTLEDGATVKDALAAAGVGAVKTVHVNNIKSSVKQEVADGDVVLVVPDIKGGIA